MNDHPIKEMMDTTLQKIREAVDATTVIGDPIIAGETTVIPVSKISYGFASGGSDFPNRTQQDCFGGGGGAGVTVAPVGFLVINGSDVRMIPVNSGLNAVNQAIDMVPDVVDKIREVTTKLRTTPGNS